MEEMKADSGLIRWLLEESGVSRYKISKDIGMSESMLSRLVREEISLDSIRFGYAKELTAYARRLQAEQAKAKEGSTTP